MAARKERCSRCGMQVLVPPGAQGIQCNVCQASTWFRPYDPWRQVKDSMSHAIMRPFKFLVNTLPSNANTIPGAHVNGYSYHTQPPRPVLPPPPAFGRKRAVLCGVSYYGKLKGSVNDANNMRYFLVEKLGFPNDSVLVLTDDQTDLLKIPTKQNIRMAMRWLVQGCQPGDSLVFFFSGHGSRLPDSNMDEIDGLDEALCPLDFEKAGKLVDDEINATIVRPLPHGVKLHAIIDSCFSGTVLDLQFVCKRNREGSYIWEDHRCPSGEYKGTRGGLAICISACDDHQTSADTAAFTGSIVTGALTYSFIQAVENEPGLTYGRLLDTIRYAICEAKSRTSMNHPFVSAAPLNRQSSQEPQVSSSEQFAIYSKKFIL